MAAEHADHQAFHDQEGGEVLRRRASRSRVQPAIITGTVMKAVSRISGSEMPSTPEVVVRVQRGIQGSAR